MTNTSMILRTKKVLSKLVKRNSPFVDGAVIFGEAEDGLPMAWNLKRKDSPNIIIWDKLVGQGLKILKVIAEFIFRYQRNTQMEFIVLTVNPEEWGELNKYGMGMSGDTSCIGIIPFYSDLADKVLSGLARWSTETHKGTKHPVILLIDGMENLTKVDKSFKDHFRCILDIGRRKNVYVVGTVNRDNFSKVQDWLYGFQQEIYGQDAIDLFEIMIEKEIIYFVVPETELI